MSKHVFFKAFHVDSKSRIEYYYNYYITIIWIAIQAAAGIHFQKYFCYFIEIAVVVLVSVVDFLQPDMT